MIRAILNLVARGDDYLGSRLGRSYLLVLGVGLVVEVVRAMTATLALGARAGSALVALVFASLLAYRLARLRLPSQRRRPPQS